MFSPHPYCSRADGHVVGVVLDSVHQRTREPHAVCRHETRHSEDHPDGRDKHRPRHVLSG